MDNCKVKNQAALTIQGKNSTAYITNSLFINAALDMGGKAAWIENCVLQKSKTPAMATVVIKNSKLLGGITVKEPTDGDSIVFLINNSYDCIHNKKIALWLMGAFNKFTSNSHCYLYADTKTKIPGETILSVGNYYIENIEFDNFWFYEREIQNLNLNHVMIRQGDWEEGHVKQGKWQNVQIYPPVNLNRAKIGKITGYQVEYPQGTPWVNGSLQITPSSKPLQFDRPKVPTLEETGLAEFWRKNDFPVENY
jgi:hypothetical protein